NGLPPGSMGGYYTFSQMNSKMDELVATFPNLVQKTSIGLSVEGRDIWCLKISDNVTNDEEEPEVLYLGLQHAREAITGTSLIFFAQYLGQNYDTLQSVTELVNNREIFIVPCVNPDGYVYNQTNNPGGGGMQRKNRRNVGSDITGQKGVDLNRNYGVDWSDCAGASTSCGSDITSYETYWGSGAFSEPETQAIRDLCYSRNFVAAFDQHCAGPYYSLPFGRRSYHTMSTLDQYFYTFIPALMGKYNGHRAGDSYATVQYEVAGGAKDWWLLGDIESYPGEPNKKGKVYGMTGEAGGGGFWAPSSQIIELCKNLCFQNMQLAFAAGSYVDLQDANDIAVTSLDSVMRFNIRRIGIGDEPVIVNLIPLQNIGSTKADTINSLPVYYDTYSGSVPVTFPPGLGNGQRIKFVWRVQTGGITIYDTVTKIFNPVTLFSDDMETGSVSTNWEVSSGWDYVSAGGVNSSRALTESPSGNYTSSSTRIAATRNPFDLSNATAAYISFWTRHRAENFRDILRVQISTNSTDGLNGTWTNLVGRNTVQENNTTNQGRLGGMPDRNTIWFL
ncbi:MAG TPA: M14 family metallopeptidase, partial [Chitinophagaceae bacterium]|nr:M14 family metallopeptidase [Chitinophagaceae bacterium]